MRVVGGKFKGRGLAAPRGEQTRPTTDRTRESLFNILSNSVNFADVAVLDLFAGTGALGIEALSRGAKSSVFVENAKPALSALRKNIDALGLSQQTKLIMCDATKLPERGSLPSVDLVFADPPYGKGLGEKAATRAASVGWLNNEALFVLEERSDSIPQVLPHFSLDHLRQYGNTSIGFYRFVG